MGHRLVPFRLCQRDTLDIYPCKPRGRLQENPRSSGISQGVDKRLRSVDEGRNPHDEGCFEAIREIRRDPKNRFLDVITAPAPERLVTIRYDLDRCRPGILHLLGESEPLIPPVALEGGDHRDAALPGGRLQPFQVLFDVQSSKNSLGVTGTPVGSIVLRQFVLIDYSPNTLLRQGRKEYPPGACVDAPFHDREFESIGSGFYDDGALQGEPGERHVVIRHRCMSIETHVTFDKTE